MRVNVAALKAQLDEQPKRHSHKQSAIHGWLTAALYAAVVAANAERWWVTVLYIVAACCAVLVAALVSRGPS